MDVPLFRASPYFASPYFVSEIDGFIFAWAVSYSLFARITTAEITMPAPKIFDKEMVSPRIIIAKETVTTTSNVEMIAALAVSIHFSP